MIELKLCRLIFNVISNLEELGSVVMKELKIAAPSDSTILEISRKGIVNSIYFENKNPAWFGK